MTSEQDLGPHQERQPTMSDGMTPERPIEETGLRILATSGAEIDYRSEQDLISKIWESSIYTEGQPDCAVAVLLSIDDDDGLNRVHVDSTRGQTDLDTIERTIALLKAVRHALQLSRLQSA
jgi:hypothetical protein